MKKRNHPRLLAVLCLVLVLSLALGTEAFALTLGGSIRWSGDTAEDRPESVTVALLEDGKELASAEAAAGDDWAFRFELPDTAEARSYAVRETVPEGYAEDESAHRDIVTETVITLSESWEKYAPCAALDIPALSRELIAGKTTAHPTLVIWTAEELDAEAKEAVDAAVRKQPGVGNPKKTVFIYGDKASALGMTVDMEKGSVLFDAPSSWSLLFGNVYTKKAEMTSPASITNIYQPTPTPTPTAEPTATPTAEPTAEPTATPTATPTAEPTATPTATPTAAPTATPTAAPTATPTAAPTATPTAAPTATPTAAPTATPTAAPTATPTAAPTATPTAAPTATPTAAPSAKPSEAPKTGLPGSVFVYASVLGASLLALAVLALVRFGKKHDK